MTPKRKGTSEPGPLRLLAYYRVSDRRGREGPSFISVLEQERLTQAAALTGGHEIIETGEDMDRPGKEMSRPTFDRFLEMIRQQQADGLVVARLDRFARSLSGASKAVEEIEKHGGVLISAREQIDTSSPAGKFLRNVLFAAAEWERDRLAESWYAARSSAVRRGIHVAYSVSPGFERGPETDDAATDRKLFPHPLYAEPMRDVFRMAAYSSDSELAAFMNEAAIPAWLIQLGERPTYWQPSRIPRLLANRVYLGEASSGGGMVNKKAHEPLVTPDVWLAAQRRNPGLSLRKPARNRTSAEVSILSGLIRCAGCRFAMAPQSARGTTPATYRGATASVHGRCPAPSSITKRKSEDYVIEQFLAHHEGQATAKRTETDGTANAELLKLEHEAEVAYRSYDAALTNVQLRSTIGDADMDRMIASLYEDWQKKQETFDEQETEDGGELAELVPDGVSLSEFVELLRGENRNAELRRLLASGIEAVFVRPAASRARNVPAGDRMKIVFRGAEKLDLPPRRGNRDRAFRPHPYVW